MSFKVIFHFASGDQDSGEVFDSYNDALNYAEESVEGWDAGADIMDLIDGSGDHDDLTFDIEED